MKNILVTGGAGYIGSHVCHLLVDNGYNVTCIDSLITGNKKLIPKEVELNIFDNQCIKGCSNISIYCHKIKVCVSSMITVEFF